MRAAFFISRRYFGAPPALKAFLGRVGRRVQALLGQARKMTDGHLRKTDIIPRTRREIQERMSSCGAAVRNPEKVSRAVDEAWALYRKLRSGIKVRSLKDLPDAFKNLDLCLTHALYLEAISEYLSKGGRSRGSFLVLDRSGEKPCPQLGDEWRYSLNRRPSFVNQKILEISLSDKGEAVKEWVGIRPIPRQESWFETVWEDFREDRLTGKKESR